MNVYDFDNTIFRGDSTARFYGWCFRHYPCLIKQLPAQLINACAFALRLRKKQVFKEHMYRFLRDIPDIDAALEAFWRENIGRIKQWYRDVQKPDDVIISASPEFLLEPAMRLTGINSMMASRVDKHTGLYTGLNCHGAEKVERFRAVYSDSHIENFYSDSLSDTPLALMADKAYIVKGDALSPWPGK